MDLASRRIVGWSVFHQIEGGDLTGFVGVDFPFGDGFPHAAVVHDSVGIDGAGFEFDRFDFAGWDWIGERGGFEGFHVLRGVFLRR